MGGFSSYYKGERKKFSKKELEKRADRAFRLKITPRVEIIGKAKKK